MRKTLIQIVLPIILVIISCNDDNIVKPIPPEPVEYDTLMPLNVGNYWLYRKYTLEPDGSGGTPGLWKFGFIIDGTLTQYINGDSVTVYKLFNCGEELSPYYDKPGSFEGSKLIYHNSNGIYYAGMERYDTLKMTFNDLIFPYPVEKGDSTSGHVFFYSNSGNYLGVPEETITDYVCVSTDSLFTTPLGEFNCIVYKMAYYDFKPLFRDEVYYFIKPGIGIVGMVQKVYHYSKNEYWYMRKVLLTDYQINKE